jgi:hypothetical protein
VAIGTLARRQHIQLGYSSNMYGIYIHTQARSRPTGNELYFVTYLHPNRFMSAMCAYVKDGVRRPLQLFAYATTHMHGRSAMDVNIQALSFVSLHAHVRKDPKLRTVPNLFYEFLICAFKEVCGIGADNRL